MNIQDVYLLVTDEYFWGTMEVFSLLPDTLHTTPSALSICSSEETITNGMEGGISYMKLPVIFWAPSYTYASILIRNLWIVVSRAFTWFTSLFDHVLDYFGEYLWNFVLAMYLGRHPVLQFYNLVISLSAIQISSYQVKNIWLIFI